jgi:hypothetical protein
MLTLRGAFGARPPACIPNTNGASLGAISIEVDGASPQPGDGNGGSLRNLVMCGIGIGVPGSAALGNVTLAPRSSGAMGQGVSALLLLGSPGFLSPHIDWRRVEDNAEFVCSQVTVVDRLLHETLASVGRDILCLIQISLKKERKVCQCVSGFLRVSSLPPIFVSTAPATKVARVATILLVDIYAQEDTTARDSAVICIKDMDDRATLAQREAQVRVSRVEAETTVENASTHEDVEGLVRMIAFLEGELVEARWAREVAEENSHGLFDAVVDAE